MAHELKAKHIQTETLENKSDDRIQSRNIFTYVQDFLSNLGDNDLVPKNYVDLLFESVGIEKYKGSYETLSDAEFEITDPEIDDLIVIRDDKSIYWYDGSSWEPVGGSTETPATIKTKYESNANTNAFTDSEKSKLSGIATGATKNANTDELSEGTNNKYFTEARAVASKLAGYVKAATVSAITSATSILDAIGILEKALDNKVDKVAGSGLITDAEKLIFADKYTKNETDNLISGAISSLIWKNDVAEFADLATEYPDAIEGWTSVVNDENKIYRFDGTDWIPIGDITIPMATDSVDGKMSKEDFVKLRDIEAEATKNTNTDELGEGTTNKYFTEARSVASKIVGYVKAGNPIPLAETDSILQALGKLEGLLDTKIPIRGDNFIATRPTANKAANGTHLQNIINELASFTPGGNPLSHTNRAYVLVMPGEYNGDISLLNSYIDIIGFGSKNGVIINGNIETYFELNKDHRIENMTVKGDITCYGHTEVCVYRNLIVDTFWCDTLGVFENIEHSGIGDYLFEVLSGGTFKNIYTPKALGGYTSSEFNGIIEECRVEAQHYAIGLLGTVTRSYFKGNNAYDAIFDLHDGAEISYTTIINESDQETGTEWAVTNFKRYGAPDTDKEVRIHHCHFVAKDGALSPKVINTIENGHNTWDSEGEGDGIQDIIAGDNITIDKTDPKNPVINASGGDGSGYETPEEVRDALESLTGADRLDASAVKNLPQGFSGSWDDLSDKPSLFPPAAHTHDISEVSGLSAALSGKVSIEEGKGLIDITKEANIPANTNNVIAGLEAEIEANARERIFVVNFRDKLEYIFEWTESIKINSIKVKPGSGQTIDLGGYVLGTTLSAWTPLEITSNQFGVVELIGELSDELINYYVRPLGTTYGTGDGSSYENAWSGFSAIDWESIDSGSKLYICGTHNELLDVKSSDFIIQGDYEGDPGVIDHTGNTGIRISSRDNITLNNITSLNALVNGLLIEGTSSNIVTNNCEFSNTGNQGIQHLNTASATHNNPICKNNLDDGISGHDDAVIVVNGGVFEENDQAINVVNRCNLTVSGNPTFINNTTYDLWVTNATEPNSCLANVSNCNFTGNVSCQAGAVINMDNSTVAGTFRNESIVNVTKSVIGNMIYGAPANESTFNECVILASNNPPALAVVNYNKSRIFGTITISGQVNASHCIFDATGGVNMTLDALSGGSLNVKYSVFKNIIASKFGVAARTGAVEVIVNNCNFIGNNNIGRGTFSQIDIEINNCIYTGLETGHQRTAGVSTLNNCSFFDNSTDKAGAITSNNEVTGNPLFTDIENEDYSLSEGSPCIDAGIDTGFPEGIDTANWGDSENTPVVSTKLQGENYDIGAYVK